MKQTGLTGLARSATGPSSSWAELAHTARRPAFTVEAELRRTIIETEWLLKDEQPSSHLFLGEDIQLEYYEDGCPMLPTCLARRPPLELAQAA